MCPPKSQITPVCGAWLPPRALFPFPHPTNQLGISLPPGHSLGKLSWQMVQCCKALVQEVRGVSSECLAFSVTRLGAAAPPCSALSLHRHQRINQESPGDLVGLEQSPASSRIRAEPILCLPGCSYSGSSCVELKPVKCRAGVAPVCNFQAPVAVVLFILSTIQTQVCRVSASSICSAVGYFTSLDRVVALELKLQT